MSSSSLVKNFGYRLVETFGVQFIQLLISIVLARLLLPDDYGIVAIASTLITILTSVVQSSFNTPLVQKKELSDLDSSSSFYMMLAISLTLYTILFFAAPWISKIYNMPQLVGVIRTLSIVLVIGSWNSVQLALVYRNFRFKQSMVISIFALVVQGCSGIALAYCGYGVWSLVWSQIIYNVLVAVLYVKCNHWFPKLRFSWYSIKCIWKLGLPLLGAELMTIGSSNINPMVIGLVYSPASLGAYQKGTSIPTSVINGTISACSTVYLPLMSQMQDDISGVRETLKKGAGLTCFFIVPISLGLCAVSEDFILLVLGKQWKDAIMFMSLACIMLAFYPLRIRLQAIKALGQGKHALIINSIHSVFSLVMLVFAIFVNLYAVMASMILSELCYVVCVSIFLKTDVGYSIQDQIKDVILPYITGSLMCLFVLLLGKLMGTVSLFSFVLKILAGVLAYFLLSLLIQRRYIYIVFRQFKKL